MGHVFYDYKTPTTFEEHLDFSYDVPYSVRIKRFATEDIVPLHYGDTIEILLCDDLVGKLTIDNQVFTLGGKQLFVVPPNIVHSNAINVCDGTMYVLKVSFDAMSNFINLTAIMEYCNKQLSQLAFTCPEYDKVYRNVQLLIEQDDNFFACLSSIISIFNILQYYAYDPVKETNTYALKHSSLHDLIKWTQDNFDKKISLDDVAKRIGYSKCYFCNKFKAITGTTYLDYLNSVRIAHACRLLQQNKSISEVCFACGFENVSYFIQLFKKIHGITPRAYAKKH